MIPKLPSPARAVMLLSALLLLGCKSYSQVALRLPDWSPDQERLSTAELNGNQVTIHNVRHCDYRSTTDYDVTWYDKSVDLTRLRTVDFVMVPFGDVPGFAHTMLSYGFEGDDYVGISIETRRLRGETYDPVKGLVDHYPLHYVIADEQDLIGRRAIHDMNDVYVYRANANAEQARAMFLDMLERANQLAVKPEFYNTLINNCTTNVVRHVNRVANRERIPLNPRILLPGYSDRLAYQLGLISSDKPFEATRQQARVNEAAYVYRDDPNFSRLIRR